MALHLIDPELVNRLQDEHARHLLGCTAISGHRWRMDVATWLELRRERARIEGDPDAEASPPPAHWQPADDDRLLGLPILVRPDATGAQVEDEPIPSVWPDFSG